MAGADPRAREMPEWEREFITRDRDYEESAELRDLARRERADDYAPAGFAHLSQAVPPSGGRGGHGFADRGPVAPGTSINKEAA